jgi:RNA polymerase sigma factor (sigma-70 family)
LIVSAWRGEPDDDDSDRELADLYRREWSGLLRVAYLLTNSTQVAEEIVQDAFVALQSTSTVVANPGAYLRTSVVNSCRSFHRHRAVVARSPVRRADAVVPEHDELFDALNALSWRQQAVLVLRFHVDLPEAAIADILHCRPSTVRSITKRALANLRKALS